MEEQAYTDNPNALRPALRPTGNGIVGQNLTNKVKKVQYIEELDALLRTIALLGELQDRMHSKLNPVRAERLSKTEPVNEPTSSTGESPLVTSLKEINYQATRILQNFTDTYDEIDL